MEKNEAIEFLLFRPYLLGRMLGFRGLTEMHNDWIRDMLHDGEDATLQAHRGSYKTTCVSIALALLCVLRPSLRLMFMRKTEGDVREIIAQVRKILEAPEMGVFVQAIYGVPLTLTVSNAGELSTNLSADLKGAPQLIAMGMTGSLTGKHCDRIFTDDIVNLSDRLSRAERERTKSVYQELNNIRNRGGRIYNTGTPWHKDDAFSLMPPPERWDFRRTGLLSETEIARLKGRMTGALFAANYELRHVAEDSIIFQSPRLGGEPGLLSGGEGHIDAAYGGGDFTAFTLCRRVGETYYLLGRLWRRPVDDCVEEIIRLRREFQAVRLVCESNGDKGYLAKELRRKGERVVSYHERMNKFIKITGFLKAEWANVVFVRGTDAAYIDQICDYNEDALHDDAPDSAACAVRRARGARGEYRSVF